MSILSVSFVCFADSEFVKSSLYDRGQRSIMTEQTFHLYIKLIFFEQKQKGGGEFQ